MITCKSGVTIRMKVRDISEQGRATQGVKLIRLDEGDEIAAITKLDEEDEVVSENGAEGENNSEATNPSENSSQESDTTQP